MKNLVPQESNEIEHAETSNAEKHKGVDIGPDGKRRTFVREQFVRKERA
jgi:hypothetical protein